MKTVYFIEVEQRDLLKATDMLRYDSCYSVEKVGRTTYRLACMQFTPARWRSYNAVALQAGTKTVTSKAAEDLYAQAEGLTQGLRLAQYLTKLAEWRQHGGFVEGSIIDQYANGTSTR